MKKYAILALAALMVVAFTLPSYALENEFGGQWDTRFQTKKYYTGFERGDIITPGEPPAVDDTEQNVETRTRLYYTAKINDNLKLVNKFEMDATWGDSGSYGRVGADSTTVEIKNTYADFNVGPVNFTVGAQDYNLFRSFYIAKDASGVIGRWKPMDNFVLAASWLKVYEDDTQAGSPTATSDNSGFSENDDVDSWTITGAFWFNENISIKPSFNWVQSSEPDAAARAALTGHLAKFGGTVVDAPNDFIGDDLNQYTFGFDFDMAYDWWGLWVTAIGQGGSVDDVNYVNALGIAVEDDLDYEGWLFALGGNVVFGNWDIYGEFAYAAGTDDEDELAFSNPNGGHVWSELLGDGTLWGGNPAGNATTTNADYSIVTDLMYVGAGVKWTPMDKLVINPSVWYAKLDEDNLTGDDTLGTEVDLNIKYQLVEGMNLELIGAYLFADDAFSDGTEDNEEDAYEYGMRLSLSF